MDDLSFKTNAAREQQKERQKQDMNRAAREMRMRTMMQGRKMVEDFNRTKVEELTPEWMRWAALKVVCPKWYSDLWFKMLSAMLQITKGFWMGMSWLIIFPFGFPVLQRIARIMYRGGHVCKVGQGPGEYIVRVKIFKWWTLVYQYDMDIRSGRVTEEFKPQEEAKKK